jgi:monovalent cation/proton antiporter, MnhG/PhaG subunit
MTLDAVSMLLAAVSPVFLLIGAVGLVRLPGVFNRMHSTTEATTLGASSALLAAALHFRSGASLTAVFAMLFLFATAPVGAHLISRAAFEEDMEPPQDRETNGS